MRSWAWRAQRAEVVAPVVNVRSIPKEQLLPVAPLRLLSFNIQVGIQTTRYRHYVTNGWKHVLPHMRKARSGVITNISSGAAVMSVGIVGYKVSKAGVNAITHNIAMGNAKYGIRCNAVMPGLLDGELDDMRWLQDQPCGTGWVDL